MNIYIKNKIKKQGFLVLTSILIVCTTLLIIIIGTFLRSMSKGLQMSDLEKSNRALAVVDSCGEYVLGQMVASTSATTTAENWAYNESKQVSIGTETCYIVGIYDGGSGNKLIKATSTVSGFTRKLLIDVSTSTPKIIINSWDYVADF